jgi:hypothetical protein
MNNDFDDKPNPGFASLKVNRKLRASERGTVTIQELLWGFVFAVVILSIFLFISGTVRKKVFCAVENVFAQQGQQGSDCP